ncbi:MAG: peptidylprolyl isomerase [Oscillospiraceae bacterium]|nr:peptidylprolyl isomerase [Oscillospiraceae bacterium]
MSASSKKKLRKELNAAAMTEKQLQEQKETKKLRLYTAIFGAAIAVMILVVIVSRIFGTGVVPRNTTALTVGETKVSAAELNHYYIDSVNNFLTQAGDMVSLFGLDTTKALDEQFYSEVDEKTWSDYFMDQATASAQNMYAVYNAAKAEGFTLSEDAKASIDATVENMKLYATMYGFGSADAYITAMYGEGCNEKTFRQYAEVQMIAQEFATAKNESLTYDDAAIRAKEAENFNAFSNFTYNYCYLAASKFYEGGTENEDGTKTYSDEEMEAGRAAAEAAANSLMSATNIAELDAAYAALEINAEVENAKSTRRENYQYANVDTAIREWVTSADRASGDIALIPSEYTSHDHAEGEECTGDNDTKSVSGYYVVLFEGKDDNLTQLVNVRHILFSYEGGTTDETTGTTTYSDEEKAKAKAAADEILAAFEAGEKTEEAFAALATEKTTDPGSKENGGLYENVYPGQMVTAFNDWCFDAARKTGDTAIVETEYGCHVMYFVGNSDMTYRDFMIESSLRNADLSAWETGLIDAAKLEVLNTKYVKTDLVLSNGE